jgi:hypothetical protein
MVEIIGIATIGTLCWLLAVSMATESDAEKRRLSSLSATTMAGEAGEKRAVGSGARHAA